MEKAGRPKQEIVKDKVISVRMEPDKFFEVKKYAEINETYNAKYDKA